MSRETVVICHLWLEQPELSLDRNLEGGASFSAAAYPLSPEEITHGPGQNARISQVSADRPEVGGGEVGR